MKRRVLACCATLLLLNSCGFHPLYAPQSHLQSGLSEVFVDVVFGRNGQLLRQALQERLQGSAEDSQPHYVLTVGYSVSTDAIGVESDSATTRNRFVATAKWTLKKPGLTGDRITSGIARTVDGNDVIVAQFFYSDLNSESVNRRLGDALADKIVQSLAVYFRAHPGLI